jgi:hypothetical protein
MFPKPGTYILFGEGYGSNIQACGPKYRDDPGFMLFDIRINNWWISQEDLQGMADQLEVPRAPELGVYTENEIIENIKSQSLSFCSKEAQDMEGVVCRSFPQMLFRSGEPIMWKLKIRDFN